MSNRKPVYPLVNLFNSYADHPLVKMIANRKSSNVQTTNNQQQPIENTQRNELSNPTDGQPVQQPAVPELLNGKIIQGARGRIESFKNKTTPIGTNVQTTTSSNVQDFPRRKRIFTQQPVAVETRDARIKRKGKERADKMNRGMSF